MKTRRKPWVMVLVVFLCVLCVALSSMVGIIQREGVEGVFNRKRDALKQVMPDAVPVLDKIEERVKKGD